MIFRFSSQVKLTNTPLVDFVVYLIWGYWLKVSEGSIKGVILLEMIPIKGFWGTLSICGLIDYYISQILSPKF